MIDKVCSPEDARWVSRLRLAEFRNYASLDWEPSSGLNLLVGENAQGKTNLLEALYLASTTRLLRGLKDAEAIRSGAERAEVRVDLAGSGTIGLDLVPGTRKRATLNGMALPRAADLLGRLPGVSLSVADLPIVREGASERRLFLDLELSALYPAYLKHLTTYRRALDQRNSLLKLRPWPDEATFEPWEIQMAASGSAMREFRENFIRDLTPAAREFHGTMGAGESLRLTLQPKDEAITTEQLRERLAASRRADLERGSTSVGPHRDDLLIEVAGREARLFGSQGQQRTAAIALKMATHELLRDRLAKPPLLLLDDMLSDLDENRRRHLVAWVLERAGQAVLTCTDLEAAGGPLAEAAQVFWVKGGVVTPR